MQDKPAVRPGGGPSDADVRKACERLLELHAKATPPPWNFYGPVPHPAVLDVEYEIGPPPHDVTGGFQHGGPLAIVAGTEVDADPEGNGNARLVAEYRNLVPVVAAELLRRMG